MLKSHRETVALAESLGLKVLRFEKANSTHHHAIVEAPDGRVKKFPTASSPSDNRWLLNKKKDFRLFLRGVY